MHIQHEEYMIIQLFFLKYLFKLNALFIFYFHISYSLTLKKANQAKFLKAEYYFTIRLTLLDLYKNQHIY